MPEIGRRIYFNKITGGILADTGECAGDVVETTIEHDFNNHPALAGRSEADTGIVQLEYGQYRDNFESLRLSRVNPQTLELEFIPYDPEPISVEEPNDSMHDTVN